MKTIIVCLMLLGLAGCIREKHDNIKALTKLEWQVINDMSPEKKAYILSELRYFDTMKYEYFKAIDSYNKSHNCPAKSSGTGVGAVAAGVVIGNALSGK